MHAPLGFDPDDHLARIGGVLRDQRVETRDPLEPFRQPFGGEPVAGLVHQMDVMVGLGPVIAHENSHLVPPRLVQMCEPAGFPSGDLMDQCSTARHPMSAWWATRTCRPGHALALGIPTGLQGKEVLTGQRLETRISRTQHPH